MCCAHRGFHAQLTHHTLRVDRPTDRLLGKGGGGPNDPSGFRASRVQSKQGGIYKYKQLSFPHHKAWHLTLLNYSAGLSLSLFPLFLFSLSLLKKKKKITTDCCLLSIGARGGAQGNGEGGSFVSGDEKGRRSGGPIISFFRRWRSVAADIE